MTVLAPLAASLVLAATVLPAAADPTYWRVTGVAPGDTLNVRAGPSAGSEDIGDLARDAAGIEIAVMDASGDWGRIVWQEGNGWLAMRFLAPDPQPPISGTSLPAGLLCSGTEPFWSIRIGDGSAVYSDIEGTMLSLAQTDARIAEGRASQPVLLAHGGPSGETVEIIAPADCSDGMSERLYPWRIDMLLDTGGQSRFLTGCCQLPLEAGK